MEQLQEVRVGFLPPDSLESVIGPARTAATAELARAVRNALGLRAFIHVNSTAAGGGVAEMLANMLAQTRGLGIDTRWLVIGGDPDFFAVTKRLHNHLYGHPGDGQALGEAEHDVYDSTLAANARELGEIVRPGDLVVLHDPQTAALIAPLQAAGALVIWRCHIGRDEPNDFTTTGWGFLRRYLEPADMFVFSRPGFAPPWVPADRLRIIQPSVDPLSPKNQQLDPTVVRNILLQAQLLAGKPGNRATPFLRRDGSPGRVDRHADLLDTAPPPPPEVPLVVQVSRWDRMKDMRGVLTAFAEQVAPVTDAHLLLVGPPVTGVADDPEAAQDLAACQDAWRRLPASVCRQIHLACLPLEDLDENAAIVNALQRHATIVVQKSLAEGFGLTVAEAMWKSRPVVATAVGGIADQVTDGESGLLINDPADLDGFSSAVRRLLADAPYARRLGDAARARVHESFLPDRHLNQWGGILEAIFAQR